MTPTVRPVNPCRQEPPDSAAAFLAEVAALAERRGTLLAELWTWTSGPFTAREVLVRRDLDRLDAELAELAGDGRAVLALAAVNARLTRLEAAAAKAGAA